MALQKSTISEKRNKKTPPEWQDKSEKGVFFISKKEIDQKKETFEEKIKGIYFKYKCIYKYRYVTIVL